MGYIGKYQVPKYLGRQPKSLAWPKKVNAKTALSVGKVS